MCRRALCSRDRAEHPTEPSVEIWRRTATVRSQYFGMIGVAAPIVLSVIVSRSTVEMKGSNQYENYDVQTVGRSM